MFKRKVLVVDDQEINRKLLNRILVHEYQVLDAANGREALEILRKEPEISAVLLDIMMPVMDGYEVLKEMTADTELSKIPVLVSSQKDGEDDELMALSLGANDFIAKPYKAEIILRRVGNTINLRETAAIINRAQRDELTGLYNKQFFLEKAKEILARNPQDKFDMVCVGIERFKLVNDTYGEKTGDKVLQHIATVLAENKPANSIVGRFLGDDFYIMQPHSEPMPHADFKERLKKINDYPIDMELRVHCGIYCITGTEDSVSNICDSAKLAAVENRGKFDAPFTYYNEAIRKRILEEQFVLTHMQESLERGEFQVYYQPKYDLTTELIVGAEALVRWVHPEKGIISPGAFIPIIEKNGFITQLDKFVWEKACQDMAKWKEEKLNPIAVSVNVSRVDLYMPTLVDDILNLVAKYKININQLHLEITESAYTENPEQIIRVVTRFRNMGFIIEMDDFGSGYSSLNMLARMPVDVLKLDMNFVQTEELTTNGRGVMSFVVSLAKWMNLTVIAEGVETAGQIAMLRGMDCNYVQGYYFARPMNEDDFLKLLKGSQIGELGCRNLKNTMDEYVHGKVDDPKKEAGRIMLIVDDMEGNSNALASIFYDEYNVVIKGNGKEAWDYLLENYAKVDVVMLDLIMPIMDGFTLLKLIRSTEETKHLAVIVTSQSNWENEQRVLELKANDFISKPYRAELIRHRVHNVAPKIKLDVSQEQAQTLAEFAKLETDATLAIKEKIKLYVKAQSRHFDIVRLVQPELTMVCEKDEDAKCENEFCYSVWGKQSRCSNCISLRALKNKGRCSKLEYSHGSLYFIISEFVPYGVNGAVVEMVTKLDNEYIDNMFEKDLLYLNLDEIQQQIEYDPLTGIYNRRHIDRHLKNYVELARRHHKNLCLAMIDIDSFKSLNDNYGHLIGDEALREVAHLLQTNIAISKGDFVARFGGDEFMLVCRDISVEVFRKRMEGILELVRHLKPSEELGQGIAVSIGSVSSEEFPGLEAMELVKEADKRLYKAKKTGKNCLVSE